MAEVDTHLSGTDSDAACVNTPAAPLSVPLAAHRCHADLV